ncbi:MAG: Rieske (2Fe-2S) protein [Acidobacteriota bacterium]
MSDLQLSEPLARRRFLVRVVAAVHAAIGGALAFVLGTAAVAPGFERRRATWIRAGAIDRLREHEPVPVTLRVARQDGYAQVVDRRVVYLVRTGERTVRALESTCTHLGCRTSYDRERRLIQCPCHGGRFDAQGQVVAGPPPAPLPALPTRVEGDDVLVEL